jgi:hypothetical protein
MTFGDVLAITLLIVVTVITLWAGIVAFSVVFSGKARIAAQALTERPGRQIGFGFLIAAVSTGITIAFLSKGGPVASIGFFIAAAIMALAVMGSAGLAMVVAERLKQLDTTYSPLSSTVRGAALSVAVGLIPVIGWFFLFPAALCASLGAGMTALTTRKRPAVAVEEPVSIPVAAEI